MRQLELRDQSERRSVVVSFVNSFHAQQKLALRVQLEHLAADVIAWHELSCNIFAIERWNQMLCLHGALKIKIVDLQAMEQSLFTLMFRSPVYLEVVHRTFTNKPTLATCTTAAYTISPTLMP